MKGTMKYRAAQYYTGTRFSPIMNLICRVHLGVFGLSPSALMACQFEEMKRQALDGILKYRKKPVVIEAMELSWGTFHDALEWGGDKMRFSNYDTLSSNENNPAGHCIKIDTLEGTMTARLGDYIIKGVQGEFYPCKPDVFEETYEAVM